MEGKVVSGNQGRQYRLDRLLGSGAFGKVYHGQRLPDHKEVAIKVIDNAIVHGAIKPQILEEVQALSRVRNHPNIITLYDFIPRSKEIYIVMELARGGDLSTLLRSRGGRLDEPTALKYFWQIASALHFCHKLGVTHRDVKPQNILVDEAGALKLSDFGISALAEQHRGGMLHTVIGTRGFTAPEVSSGRYDGAKADSWSCGIILFLFIAGRLPSWPHRPLVFPSEISEQTKHMIRDLLKLDPKGRKSIDKLANDHQHHRQQHHHHGQHHHRQHQHHHHHHGDQHHRRP